ncbi:hypothetical protein IWW37_002844 [Coemansia sp. RSA 2050]|nr:hypothetical protein IWW37_002844 [Coemansia sp. RSA 2050]KAJ2733960.1 hypothetical protein IW152_002715 [Coemansia sp. BCRC 34962]
MGRVRDCFDSLFRRRSNSASATSTTFTSKPPASNHTTESSSPTTAVSSNPTHIHSAAPRCSIFEPPLPYSAYDTYTSESRQYISTGGFHIYKSFPSESPFPLDDVGLGRLKNVYEAWFPKSGSMSRDKVSGIYILTIVNAGVLDGTTYCGDVATALPLRKHHVQCMYSGTGIRRECNMGTSNVVCTGAELWIKSSLPVAGPWTQSLYIPPTMRLNRMCPIAKPKPDFMQSINPDPSRLALLPGISADASARVFELDSDVYVYICRLVPCATVNYVAVASGRCANEPPVFQTPSLRRAATTLPTNRGPAHLKQADSVTRQESGRLRDVYIHVFSDYTKMGTTRQGGARLMLPGSIQLSCGDGINLQQVNPGASISIKNIGYDRAQFVLVDMPRYDKKDADACSI